MPPKGELEARTEWPLAELDTAELKQILSTLSKVRADRLRIILNETCGCAQNKLWLAHMVMCRSSLEAILKVASEVYNDKVAAGTVQSSPNTHNAATPINLSDKDLSANKMFDNADTMDKLMGDFHSSLPHYITKATAICLRGNIAVHQARLLNKDNTGLTDKDDTINSQVAWDMVMSWATLLFLTKPNSGFKRLGKTGVTTLNNKIQAKNPKDSKGSKQTKPTSATVTSKQHLQRPRNTQSGRKPTVAS